MWFVPSTWLSQLSNKLPDPAISDYLCWLLLGVPRLCLSITGGRRWLGARSLSCKKFFLATNNRTCYHSLSYIAGNPEAGASRGAFRDSASLDSALSVLSWLFLRLISSWSWSQVVVAVLSITWNHTFGWRFSVRKCFCFLCHRNELPQTLWLKTAQTYRLTALEVRSPKWVLLG